MPHSISSIVPTSPWTIIKSPRLREQHTIPRSLGRGSAIIFGFLFLWGISNPLLRRSIRYSTLGLFDYSLLFHTQRTPPLTEKRERRGAFYKTAEFSLTNSRQQTLLSSCAWRARSGARCVLWPTHRDTKVQCQYFYRLHSERLCTVSVDRDYYTLLIRQFNFGFLLCVIHIGETILVVNIRWRRKNWLCLTFDTFWIIGSRFRARGFFQHQTCNMIQVICI
jgi:hypothetical protein